jgi:hypothetical protein
MFFLCGMSGFLPSVFSQHKIHGRTPTGMRCRRSSPPVSILLRFKRQLNIILRIYCHIDEQSPFRRRIVRKRENAARHSEKRRAARAYY